MFGQVHTAVLLVAVARKKKTYALLEDLLLLCEHYADLRVCEDVA
jgi:hypothetical protein